MCYGQTIRAVSPNLANAIGPGIGAPAFFVNKPNTVTASQTLASVSEQLFSIAPCLIALSQTGVQVNPILIGVSPLPPSLKPCSWLSILP